MFKEKQCATNLNVINMRYGKIALYKALKIDLKYTCRKAGQLNNNKQSNISIITELEKSMLKNHVTKNTTTNGRIGRK